MPESPLVNEHFNDFPIDYFKIRPEDFIEAFIGARGFSSPEDMQGYYTRATELYTFDTLSLDENGYLAQSVNEKIDFEISDTTVINCAVGQGKTTAILGKLKSKYDSDPDAIFIIAVPFVSLIAQYEKDLIDLGINSEDIFNYQTIGRDTPYRNVLYRGKFIKRVHIVTVNTLLGNAGKDAVLQSDAKFEYIKYLSSKIEEENKKAYFIFDVQLVILAAFFIAKWFHLCDSYYNIFRYILTNESTAVWGFWRWWTPLGLLRCNWWGFCVLPGFTELDMDAQYGNWSTDCYKRKYLNYPDYNFLKGMVSINEAWIQTALGLFLTAIILLIWA